MANAFVDEIGRIPMSPFLATTLSRAASYADAQGHVQVTIEHLLLALAEDPEASIVLKSSDVDVGRLMTDVSEHLGRIDDRAPEGATHSVVISGELKRILEAAAAAASQGRRREINGAIVLAAIVGEGQSASAHFLRAQGMTFEAVIKALQNSQSAPAPAPASNQGPSNSGRTAPPSTTDGVLASARERVQSRKTGAAPAGSQNGQALDHGSSGPRTGPPQLDEALSEMRAPPKQPPAAATAEEAGQSENDAAPQSYEPKWEPARPIPVSAPQAPPGEGARPSPPPRQQTRPASAPQTAGQPPEAMPEGVAASFGTGLARPDQQQWAPPPGPMPPQGGAGQRAPTRRPPPMPSGAAPGGPPHGAPRPNAGPGGPRPPDPRTAPPGYRPPQAPQPAPPPWNEARDPRMNQPRPRGQAASDVRSAPPRGQSHQPNVQGDPRRRAGMTVQAGQLVENIPRTMKVAIPLIVEARVSRAEVRAIAEELQGPGAVHRHEVVVSKAMTVRLRAPDGGFSVETGSPETQWIDNVLGVMADDYASWRWTITPLERGKRRLQLVVSARTAGADGVMAETALPDQVIEVKVGINYAKTAAKWAGWITAASVGGIIARFGEDVYGLARTLLDKTGGG